MPRLENFTEAALYLASDAVYYELYSAFNLELDKFTVLLRTPI